MTTIGERIELALKKQRITLTQLCKMAWITHGYLSKLVHGDRGVRIEYMTAYRIAGALGMSAHMLVTGSDTPESTTDVNDVSYERAYAVKIARELAMLAGAIGATTA